MLRVLHVKNMALIEEEKIEFGDGLNILTGETGAGKSILIGSLGVALGSGSFKDYVPENADHASVELIFETQSGRVQAWLEEHDIPDMDGQIIISRSFRKGRSISRINGEVVPIGLVRELSSDLIDIHGQHEHQSLLYPKYHLQLVDDFAG
ncbi:MAG TPA: DNA repair protein RecN, partial [Lachnospiraceae bacterium]|nr:DNA repair protein RecN [Lachnospiraceae bacterium]